MLRFPILRTTVNNTWLFFGPHTKRKVLVALFVIVIGSVLGVYTLGYREAMSELNIFALYVFAPLGILTSIVFLWSLWLAPYRIIDEKLDRIERSSGQLGAPSLGFNTGLTDPARWKHTRSLKLYQVAEISGGISPHGPSEGSNDLARAVYSELFAALQAGELKGSHGSDSIHLHTRIKREDLQKYFSRRKDCPEFLKD